MNKAQKMCLREEKKNAVPRGKNRYGSTPLEVVGALNVWIYILAYLLLFMLLLELLLMSRICG